MPKLIIGLIRHGKTIINSQGRIAGILDFDLNEEGIEEIKGFVKQGSYSRNVKFCYTSTLKRAIQTNALIYPDIPCQINPLFDEINFGDYEGSCPRQDIISNPEYAIWAKQDNSMSITAPNGEPISEARIRLDNGLKEVIKESIEKGFDEIAIVGHGNLFAEFLYVYLNDNRPVRIRMNSEFPNGLGIKVEASFENDINTINYRFIEYIR